MSIKEFIYIQRLESESVTSLLRSNGKDSTEFRSLAYLYQVLRDRLMYDFITENINLSEHTEMDPFRRGGEIRSFRNLSPGLKICYSFEFFALSTQKI